MVHVYVQLVIRGILAAKGEQAVEEWKLMLLRREFVSTSEVQGSPHQTPHKVELSDATAPKIARAVPKREVRQALACLPSGTSKDGWRTSHFELERTSHQGVHPKHRFTISQSQRIRSSPWRGPKQRRRSARPMHSSI